MLGQTGSTIKAQWKSFVLNFELEQVFIPSSRKFQTEGARLLKKIEPLRVFGRNGLKAIPCPRVVNPCDVRCSLSSSFFGAVCR